MALQVVEFQDPGLVVQDTKFKKSRLLPVSFMKARCSYQIGIFDIFWNGIMTSLVQNLGLNKLFLKDKLISIWNFNEYCTYGEKK